MKLRRTAILILMLACLVRCASAGRTVAPVGEFPEVEMSAFQAATDISLRRSQLPIVVVCDSVRAYSPADIPEGLAERITHEFQRRRLNVVPQAKVTAWLTQHPDWNTAAEIGTGVGARFVVCVEVEAIEPFKATVHVSEVYGLESESCVYSRTVRAERSGCSRIARLFDPRVKSE